jgi:Calpain family cysteine protease
VVGDNDYHGDENFEMSDDELFLKMYACDQMNFIVSAGSKGGGTDEGLVDNHAYTVIEAVHDAAGTGIDMFKVRNPWGAGEIENGEFDDDGPGWVKYPQIKALLNPVVADDGIFWVTKKEFFEMFKSVYVSASNMTKFLED